VRKLPTPDPRTARRVSLAPGDAERFMPDLRQREPVVADAVELALLTMLRRSCVLGMRWDWFTFPPPQHGHLTGGAITVPGLHTKNGDPGSLPLTGRLLAGIDRRWHRRRQAC